MFIIIHLMYWMNKYPDDVSKTADVIYLVGYRDIFIIGLILFALPTMAGKGSLWRILLGNYPFFVLGKLTYGVYML